MECYRTSRFDMTLSCVLLGLSVECYRTSHLDMTMSVFP